MDTSVPLPLQVAAREDDAGRKQRPGQETRMLDQARSPTPQDVGHDGSP